MPTLEIHFLPVLAALSMLGAGCGGDREPPEAIVLIVVDTLRRDHLSVYGGATPTPNIDSLAARGTALEATASFHQTTMSMGALFTGRTPSIESGQHENALEWRPNSWCGMARFMEEVGPGVCLSPSLPTLGERMRDQGYTTVGVVSNSLLFGAAGFARGFDEWIEVGPKSTWGLDPKTAARSRTAADVNAAAVAALDRVPEGPLFLYLHYLDVHDWHLLGLDYSEAVARMDVGIGDLIDHLEGAGLLEDAAIVLTSDHGESLGESLFVKSAPGHAGNPSTWTVLDVPLIVAGRGAQLLPPFVRTQDLHAFLMRLAGGRPSADGGDVEPAELLVTERLFTTYRRGRYKSSWSRVDDSFHLVDLEADPAETTDVAASHPEVVKAHRARMQALTRELAASQVDFDDLSEELIQRLRFLGYVERPGDPQQSK
jgi:arylsulfatase A-like enzyme